MPAVERKCVDSGYQRAPTSHASSAFQTERTAVIELETSLQINNDDDCVLL